MWKVSPQHGCAERGSWHNFSADNTTGGDPCVPTLYGVCQTSALPDSVKCVTGFCNRKSTGFYSFHLPDSVDCNMSNRIPPTGFYKTVTCANRIPPTGYWDQVDSGSSGFCQRSKWILLEVQVDSVNWKLSTGFCATGFC